jgi:hypothetical protein
LCRVAMASSLTVMRPPQAKRIAGALLVSDAIGARRIDGASEPRLRWRIALDVAEVTVWGVLVDGDHDITPALGAALTCETAVRFGPVAGVIPLAELAAVTTARLSTGQRPRFAPWVVPGGAYLAGLGVRAVETQRIRRVTQIEDDLVAAAARAGAAEGAFAAITAPIDHVDEKIDALDRLRSQLPITLERTGVPDDVRAYIEERKRVATPTGAQTLEFALMTWRDGHNRRHKRVADKVVYRAEIHSDLPEIWLTATQCEQLAAILDAAPPSGPWVVSVIDWGGYPTTAVLNLNGSRVTLRPAVDERVPRLADQLPALFLIASAWSAMQAGEIGNAIPPAQAVGMSALWLSSAPLADYWYRRDGERAMVRAAAVATALGVVEAMIVARVARRDAFSPGGTRRAPLQHALMTPTLMWSYMAGRRLARGPAVRVLAAIGVAGVGSIALQRHPRRPGSTATRWFSNVVCGAGGYLYGREQARWEALMEDRRDVAVRAAGQEANALAQRAEWARIYEVTDVMAELVDQAHLREGYPERQKVRRELRAVLRAAKERAHVQS